MAIMSLWKIMSLFLLLTTISFVYGSPSLDIGADNSENNFHLNFDEPDTAKGSQEGIGQSNRQIRKLISQINVLSEENEQLRQQLNQTFSDFDDKLLESEEDLRKAAVVGRDCKDLFDAGFTTDGIYTINVGLFFVHARCDMTNGGWTIFQQRVDGSINFRQNFAAYRNGFGDPNSEYWLGLEQIHQMTAHGQWTLRVELTTSGDETAYAEYQSFKVGISPRYELQIGSYSGTAGDELTASNSMAFSTYDKDQDTKDPGSCAEDVDSSGAWWWKQCGGANLNSYLYNNALGRGTFWAGFKGYNTPMKITVLKIRKN